MKLEELLTTAEAEYENALDDMYYGYGYDFWRTHYNDIEDDNDAKLVWKTAKQVMCDEEYMGATMFPTLQEAYNKYNSKQNGN